MNSNNEPGVYQQRGLFERIIDEDETSSEIMQADIGRGIRVLSLFSGAGGLDLGFHQLGFDILCAVEWESVFCQSIEANKRQFVAATTQVLCEDIRNIALEKLPSAVDFVIGGPPCQSFSASNRRAGGAAGRLDARGNLFEAYSSIIAAVRPHGFLFENVRGILGTHKGKDWQEIVTTFKNIGYKVSYRILDACDYGIPQHRERLILVGHQLEDDFLFPRPTHGTDSYHNIPHINPLIAFHQIKHNEHLEDLRITNGKYAHLIPLIPPGDNYLFFTRERGHIAPVFAYRSRFSDFLYKAHPEYPVKTIIASPGKYTGPLHWEDRYFSIAEYKRIQGFPDDYVFHGNRTEIIRQIGNSVSPKMSEMLAKAIAKQIFQKEVNVHLLHSNDILSFDKRKSQKARTTRLYHESVLSSQEGHPNASFALSSYIGSANPSSFEQSQVNVQVVTHGQEVTITVHGDKSPELFVEMELVIMLNRETQQQSNNIHIKVIVFGKEPYCIQTMWNAIDAWVIKSSSFHSLMELYGHFTEPHPIFYVPSFKVYSEHPIAKFAKHISDFTNCSRYFPKEFLMNMFKNLGDSMTFNDIASLLRGYRFDVRSHETNITIPKEVYMVTYPFTLPARKQMNFSIYNRSKSLSIAETEHTYSSKEIDYIG